jgi:hypothetical protein
LGSSIKGSDPADGSPGLGSAGLSLQLGRAKELVSERESGVYASVPGLCCLEPAES